MKRLLFAGIITLIAFCFNLGFAQTDNLITQNDPYIMSLKKLTFYYPLDDNPVSSTSRFVIVVKGNIGSAQDAFIKFITPDKVAFDNASEYKDGYLQDISFLDKKGVLIPSFSDFNGKNFLELSITAYTNLTEQDYEKVRKISSVDVVPVSTGTIDAFSTIYKTYQNKDESFKPSDEFWAESQAFLSGMNTRKKVDIGTIRFDVPLSTNAKNIKIAEGLVPGDRSIDNAKDFMVGILNFKTIKDEEVVYNMDYYKKLKDFFNKLAGNNFYKDEFFKITDELNDYKTFMLKERTGVYFNSEVKRQLGNLIEIFRLSTPIKADTNKTSKGIISLEGQVAVDFIRENSGAEKNRYNKYIYNDFISNDLNRVKLLRELDIIKNYYDIK